MNITGEPRDRSFIKNLFLVTLKTTTAKRDHITPKIVLDLAIRRFVVIVNFAYNACLAC